MFKHPKRRLRLLHYVFIAAGTVALLASVSAAVTLAAGIAPTGLLGNAQQETETPAPSVTPPEGPITLDADPLPACQMQYVSGNNAPVRTCAGSGCPLVDTLAQYEVVCVRGVTDNPDWLIVSLTTEDTSAPLYAIESANVTPGPIPSMAERMEDCFEFWAVAEVVTANVNVRQCPSLDCPVMDTLQPGDWVCVQDYGGEWEDWLRADIPNGLRGVWISDQVMEPLDTDGPPGTVDAVARQDASATPTPAPADSTLEPTATPDSATSTTACTDYVIAVPETNGGNVRGCPSIECEVEATLPRNSTVCVLGPSDEPGWLVVDLAPANPDNTPVYISEQIVVPVPAQSDTVIQPTASATPAPPVCEPGSALANCVTATPTPVLETTPVVMPVGPLLAQEIALTDIRVPNLELLSPFGYTQFSFFLPNDWVMDGNNVLYIDLEYFETEGAYSTQYGIVDLVSTVDVYLDDQLIAAVSLNEMTVGRQTLAIPMPLSLLDDPASRRHTVQLRFRAEDHCLSNATSQIFVRSDTSYLHFEFRESLPVLDLSLYPRPFYNQRFVSETESVYIVLPPEPSATDYQAALALSAGLGDLTFNDIKIEVTTTDQLTDEQRTSSNLILVGKIDANPLIRQFYADGVLPSALDNGQVMVDGATVGEDEGILQLFGHPENEILAAMTVTGQSDIAVLKAAQAMAGPPSLMGIGGPIAIVTDARPVVRPPAGLSLDTVLTFEDLGYPLINLGGYGLSSADVDFYMPAGYQLTDEATVDLVFNYSGMLEGSRATIAMVLNDETPIASSYLQKDSIALSTAEMELPSGPLHLRANLPADAVIPGDVNSIRIFVNVQGDWNCFPPDATVGWVSILGDSTINLPRTQLAPDERYPMVSWFPAPFNAQADLRNVWVSLPEDPSLDIVEQAMRVMARLGSEVSGGEGFMPPVSIGELPSDVDLANYHFLVFGRNTTNPFLQALNENLPQPFVPGTDDIEQILDDVVYRLPSGYEVGVLETLESPWNKDRVILVVSGTGPAGQANAAAALSEFRYGRVELLGNVVFVSNIAASPVDTREYEQAEEVIAALEELQVTATAEALITPTETPQATPEAAITVTPVPSATPTATHTPGPTDTPTPLFTVTPEPTVPTPIPTFTPLPAQDLEGNQLDPPDWFFALLVVTGIVLIAAMIYGLLRVARGSRRDTL